MNLRLALALICLNPALHAAPPKELVSLQQSYAFAVAERVTGPHETALAALNAKFTAALDNAATQAKSAGDLPAVLAIQADKKLLAEKQPLPADDEKTPESLKKLRAIYRDQLTKLEAQRAANVAALLTPYTARLQELEATLTKADRLAEAKEVMDYREGLKADAPPAPQPAMAAGTSTTTPPAGSPTTPAAPKVKGDDRKAAEWVLSVGGTVEIWENGVSHRKINTAADLPPGKLSLRSIGLNNNGNTLKAMTDGDFQVFAGLERLESISTNKLTITPAAFEVFATCPALEEIQMQYNSLGDALWPYLAGVKKLRKMVQGFDGLPVQGIGISNLSRTTMEELVLGSTSIVDEALKEIGNFTALKILILETTKISDAGVPALAGLNKLERLNVRGTNVTAAGLAALKKAPIKRLGYGVSMEDFVTQLSQVTATFPKLEELDLPRDVKPTAADWKRIAESMPQVKAINLQSQPLDDASCEGMDTMPNLEGIEFIYGKITDSGVTNLARIRKLRWLRLKNAQLTDAALETLAEMKKLTFLELPKPGNGLTEAGIAKFKKKRPEVKVGFESAATKPTEHQLY